MSRSLMVMVKRLPHGHDVALPEYQTAHAAATDVHAAVAEDVTLNPGEIKLIPTGFAMAIPEGYKVQVRPRSGLNVKHGITLPNSPGTIDADYCGELLIPLINHGTEPFTIKRHMRIAQILIAPVWQVRWQETGELTATPRGEGGFGHTGA